MKIAIGIATVGRAKTLKSLVEILQNQKRKADSIYICPVSDEDVLGVEFNNTVLRVQGKKGLTTQRNAILRKLEGYDLVVFFDDDFIPDENYLLNVEKLFTENKEIVISTGDVLKDGAKTKGVFIDEAKRLIQNHKKAPLKIEPFFGAYGCNMTIRLSPIIKNKINFDENLPLYSWLEDLDFTQRIKKYGTSVKFNTAFGVHLAVKKGRTSGVRYGYSQIVNPLYIARKKQGFTYSMAFKMILKNSIANFFKTLFPENYIDRKGRLKGNFLAIRDLFSGKLDPNNIIDL